MAKLTTLTTDDLATADIPRRGELRTALERAIRIAVEAHAGQVDKAGAAYILHPLRIMDRMKRDDARIAAVLHDVVEDCPDWTLERLRAEGFPESILTALDALTRRKGEDYFAFVRRASADPLARLVKIADIEDNTDLSRMQNPTRRDQERVAKYRQALEILRESAS